MAGRVQVVDHDRVFCARRRRDVDVETCIACVRLAGVREEDGTRLIVCTATPDLVELLTDAGRHGDTRAEWA